MRGKDYHKRVRHFLVQAGATGISFTQRRGHTRCFFNYQGRQLMAVCASTPSDRRAHKNTIAEIKRILGAE